jgi:hypothetical protein
VTCYTKIKRERGEREREREGEEFLVFLMYKITMNDLLEI